MFSQILENVKRQMPLVHSITNYVTVNDCANIILASGGSPIMADDVGEVSDITSICSSLVINIGTLNERTIDSMITAGKKANELSHPVILDPVGVGASKLRNQTALHLLKEIEFAVIRGNISEIKFLAGSNAATKGVDADQADLITPDNLDNAIKLSKGLSKETGAVIVITGETDIVTEGEKVYLVKNGHSMMSLVSGTGCMLSSVIGSFVGANYDSILKATTTAVTAMALCGELAYKRLEEQDGGTGTYRTLIIDFMSKIDSRMLKDGAKVENKQV